MLAQFLATPKACCLVASQPGLLQMEIHQEITKRNSRRSLTSFLSEVIIPIPHQSMQILLHKLVLVPNNLKLAFGWANWVPKWHQNPGLKSSYDNNRGPCILWGIKECGYTTELKREPWQVVREIQEWETQSAHSLWNPHSKSFIWQTWKKVQWGQSSQPTEQVLRKFLSWTDKTEKSTTLSQKNKNHEKIANSDAQQQNRYTNSTNSRYTPQMGSYILPTALYQPCVQQINSA